MMDRRHFLALASSLALALRSGTGSALADDDGQPFSRSAVLEQARALAAAPFAAPTPALPDSLLKISAQDYNAIRYRDDRRFFVDPPTGFGVDLLHAGFIYSVPVQIWIVDAGRARRVVYDPSLFDYGSVSSQPAGAPIDFAGFRGLAPLDVADRLMPFLVFAGASYFKAIARNQVFGASARGLAIGTGEPEGEEFPFFRSHWIEAPSGDRIVVHSLLDGPSASGAYRFTIGPAMSLRSMWKRRYSSVRTSPIWALRR